MAEERYKLIVAKDYTEQYLRDMWNAAYCKQEMYSFWDEYKRLRNPHIYKVDLTESLWMLKQSMLKPH